MMTKRIIQFITAAAALGVTATAQEKFILHEWGTFTTVSSSDGSLLAGLEEEEERLPYFVSTLDGFALIKGLSPIRLVQNVTVKMETPVIYIYAENEKPFPLQVGVRFRGGVVSQWFPGRSGGETLPPPEFPGFSSKEDMIDFGSEREGHIRWNIDVGPRQQGDGGRVFKRGETPTWIYPRVPGANVLTNAKGQREQYLFYRGMGNFTLPLRFTVSEHGVLRIENTGEETVQDMFLFKNVQEEKQTGAGLVSLGGVEAGGVLDFDLSTLSLQQLTPEMVFPPMGESLVRAGLFREEADAMLKTWWKSYFDTLGLRLFWVVPRGFTDAVLPLNVDPVPETTERVLVGRSEILTPQFEGRLLAARDDPKDWNAITRGRYGKAYSKFVDGKRAE